MDDKLAKILGELQSENPDDQNGEYEPLNATELSRLESLLPRYTTAIPTNQQTAALINNILPLLGHESSVNSTSAPRFAELADRASERNLHAGYACRLLPQLQLLSIWFWIGSIAVVCLTLLFMMQLAPSEMIAHTNPVVLLAPLLSLIAVAYACRSYGTPMYELELSYPITPAQWLTGKIASVLIAYIALFSGVSLITEWNDLSTIIPFTISWLVPLFLYCALTLALLLRLGTIGATFCMALLWLTQIWLGEKLGRFYWLGDTSFRYWASSKALGAAFTLIAFLYIIYRLRREAGSVSRNSSSSGGYL